MPEPDTQLLVAEIGTEELPPNNLKNLAQAFYEGLCEQLQAAHLAFDAGRSRWLATPRRLTVSIAALASRQPEREESRRGPAVNIAFDAEGCPSKAALGFAKSVGASVEALQRERTEQGEYLVYRSREPGASIDQLLPEALTVALAQLPVEKRMRWGAQPFEFVRPVHWLMVLYGDRIIELELFGLTSGRETFGHRFHAPAPLALEHATNYEDTLRDACVVADFEQRRTSIEEQIVALANPGRPALPETLLDEITALTEWPIAMACQFDQDYLQLPPEVIVTTLQHEQRFVPILDKTGALSARFIAVANIESKEADVVRQGFERVVRPRLADAEFLYQQDLQTPLIERRQDLKGVLFQARCGTLFDKTERIKALAQQLAGDSNLDADEFERASVLAKCDLTTNMVGEFPELQGVMGRYYARNDGERESVAQAIEEHYRPRFAGDEIPATQLGQTIALADKLDTVCVVMAAAGKPTGNKDPFGLRRQALGVLRILIEGKLDLDLKHLIALASARLPGSENNNEAEVLDFLMERLAGYYRDRGITPDVFAAVGAIGVTNPLDFNRRIQAVDAFRDMSQAASLASANKRVRNILKQAKDKLKTSVDTACLKDDAETNLYRAMADKQKTIKPLLAQSDYRSGLAELATLKAPLDAFFDEVMVMSDDPALRYNRIALLSQIRAMFLAIADISRLEITKS